MEDQSHQLQVQVGDGAARIGETDQLPEDVVRPLHLPGKVSAVFVWVNPYPLGALFVPASGDWTNLIFLSLQLEVINHLYT